MNSYDGNPSKIPRTDFNKTQIDDENQNVSLNYPQSENNSEIGEETNPGAVNQKSTDFKEISFGITEYVHPEVKGFTGIIKHRYEDFCVAEISIDGCLASLSTHLCDPELLLSPDQGVESPPTEESVVKSFPANFSNFAKELFEKFSTMGPNIPTMQTPQIESKDERTFIHKRIRELFSGRLLTETITDETGISFIQVSNQKTSSAHQRRYDHGKKRFLEFVLYKENIGTIQAVQRMSKLLHLNPKDISYAGTKDSRAITTQFMVAKNILPNKLLGLNKIANRAQQIQAKSPVMRLCNIRCVEGPLKLGDLSGNRFTLVLRDVSKEIDCKVLDQIIGNLEADGFVNYYGLQRFGTGNVATHLIGVELLCGNYKGAIDMLISNANISTTEPSVENDSSCVLGRNMSDSKSSSNTSAMNIPHGFCHDARETWMKTKNASFTLSLMPFNYTAERQILTHLARPTMENDFVGAIRSIGRELRLMYVHALQSILWNHAASARIRRGGFKVCEGDMVKLADGLEYAVVDDVNKYKIDDIYIPILGYNTQCSSQLENDFDREIVTFTSGRLNYHTFREACKATGVNLWDLPGAFRQLVSKPSNVKSQIVYYDNLDDTLTFEKYPPHNQQLDESYGHENGSNNYKGLIVAFSLQTSSYATMALREMMKVSTSSHHHANLSKTR